MSSSLSAQNTKKELFAMLLAEQGMAQEQASDIKKSQRSATLPLSFAQERLWFLDQLEPGNPVYNIPIVLRMRGPLDRFVLERSLIEIIQRHESLRTLFVDQQGKPNQVIVPTLDFMLPLIELEGCSMTAREDALLQMMSAEARYAFDLIHGPLIRAVLVRMGPDEHVFLVTMHHIISDGWSIDVLMREMSILYTKYSGGVSSSLPTLPIQYADYALWQREWLQGEVLERQLAYWTQQLADAPPLLELRTDQPRRAKQTHHGAYLSYQVTPQLSDRVKRLSRQEGVTLFMTLLSVFQILLARHSGQDDIVVGTPVAGRNRSETEQLIGFFLNNLALRSKIVDDASFQTILQQVRNVTLEAYAHQDVSFEQVLQAIGMERNPSQTPLFQVFFNMQNLVNSEMKLPELLIETMAPQEVAAKFDITLYAEEWNDHIVLNLLYNTDLFEREHMQQMLEQYQYLLEQIVENPEAQISQLSLVTATVRPVLPDPSAVLSAEWYGAVYAQLARHAQNDPAREAIRDADGVWSYAQLDARSNQLAHYLIDHGVCKGDVIAVYGYRSATLICALIGILKAGAAFCILDPAYPAERLIDYLRLLSPRGWLRIVEAGTPELALQAYLIEQAYAVTLDLSARVREAEYKAFRPYTTEYPGVVIGPDDVAVISFTSGSTGRPKGVLGRHGPLTHFFPWQQQIYGFQGADHYSVLSGLSHDPLQREIFTPLWFGATMCIPSADERNLPGRLAVWMCQQDIHIAHFTPAMIQLLMQPAPDGSLAGNIASLRYAFITGEAVTRHDIDSLHRMAPNVICVNSYGSTETQRSVANLIVDGKHRGLVEERSGVLSRAIIPVGQGIKDVQLLILNSALRQGGIGEVGEIYVRSPHLAAGYLQDAVLNSQRFICNPFTGAVDDRLYRTGDLGCYLPDGVVAMLGRRDQQIQIRGFRVETGEIEATLKQHPAVRECLVGMHEDASGEKRLCAYVVLQDEEQATRKELYQFLKQKLPAYMLPSTFTTLKALPVTPNGKIDRQALPSPDNLEAALSAPFVPADTPVKAILVTIWEQILHIPAVSCDDNFFELGGHSLLATQVISRVRDTFQFDLPLRSLFDAPTVAGLAVYIEAFRQPKEQKKTHEIACVSRESALPLSFAQQRLWFLNQLIPDDISYNVHVTVSLDGMLDLAALERSLNAIVLRHESLRTTFIDYEGQTRQVIAAPHYMSLACIDLKGSELAKDKHTLVAQLAKEEAQHPFDLVQGPLFRSCVLELGREEHILLLTMHHIVSDGWSMNVLVNELMTFYNAFHLEMSDPLPPLTIQYADYAVWQRDWLQGTVLTEQLAYWKQQLAGAPSLLTLPTDRPRPAVQTHHGAYLPFKMTPLVSDGVKKLSRQENVTPFMMLLTAFQILLARYSGQDDIVVGTPVAGRNHSEIEHLIGFFVNTLVIRTQIDDRLTFSDTLHHVREHCLNAYVHQDLPFERLVEEVHPDRTVGNSPLFQVMFVMQDAQLESLKLPDLTIALLETASNTARFDVLLSFADTPTGFEGYFEYNTDLFDDSTIERMKDHLLTLLETLITSPHQPLRGVSLLSEVERHQVLVEWNDTDVDWPSAHCVHTLFEQQVQKTPRAVAVVYGNTQYTYQELDRRANQLARFLQARNVGPESRVGLYLERSLDMPVAILGVLKAGGAYVPIDPSYPLDRVTYILNDAGITTIITQHHTGENLLREVRETQIICLDRDASLLACESAESCAVPLDPEHLAYILYTSGSTGAPKGAMITHRGLTNYLLWCRQRYAVEEGSGAPVHSSLTFDLTVTSLFSPLLVGRAVYLLPSENGVDALSDACCAQNNFSLIKITPAHLALLSQSLESRQQAQGTKLFVIGGEQLFTDKLRLWRELAPETHFVNEYGPTETVVGCCIYQVPTGPLMPGSVPIGRPIANTQIYLLDTYLQPVPVGLVGELYIAGSSLARGYLNRAALTAERFLPNPFASQPGSRLYKTGDLALYRPDGVLEFLGRNDHQVKLRGFRIELGEIEYALQSHPAVRDALVMIREDHANDERLVAYVVLYQDQIASGQELLHFLKERLPIYMVPAHILVLDRFPLTSNGKVASRQLPAPDDREHEMHVLNALPRTAIERTVAAIWQDVLHTQTVGLHDNFFDLGGHSMLIIQVHTKLIRDLQVELTLVELFQYPTINLLAECIRQKLAQQPVREEEYRRTAQQIAGKDRVKQRLRQRLQGNK